MQRGLTLLELVVALTLMAVLLALAAPRLGRWRDRLAVDRALAEVSTFYYTARVTAVFRSTWVRLEFGADTLRATFRDAADSTVLVRPGPARHGVALRVSRRVIRITPTGYGWGAANTKIVLRRGLAAGSLTTSRLGRLKRW